MQGVGRVAQVAGVEQQKQARRAGGVAIVAEVLAEGERLFQVVDVVRAEGLGDSLGAYLEQLGVVDHGAVAFDVLDVELAGAQLGGAAGEAHDLVVDDLAGLLAVGAADHLKAGGAGDDVDGLAALDDADGDDGGLERVDAAGDDLLGVNDELSQREDGVVAVLRLGTVGVLAGDLDVVEVESRGGDAVIHAHGADLGSSRRDVGGHDGVDVRVLHDAGLDHGASAAHWGLLLARLEDELYSAGQLVAHAAEHLGRGEQHGDVRVVAAGVHDAVVLACEGQAGLLLDGQSVDVRADGDALAGLGALDDGDRAGGQRALNAVAAEALEELYYLLRRAELVVAQLRMGVEIAPPGEHLIGYFMSSGSDVHDV